MAEAGKTSHVSAAVQRLTNEIFVDTLRYFSRKELISKIYLVNHRFLSLADTHIPNLYVSRDALHISLPNEDDEVFEEDMNDSNILIHFMDVEPNTESDKDSTEVSMSPPFPHYLSWLYDLHKINILSIFPDKAQFEIVPFPCIKEEDSSSILSLPHLLSCDNITWCAGSDISTPVNFLNAIEIITWLHFSNASFQRPRNLLIRECNTNRNIIHEIVKAAKELFFTDIKGSVNFSMGYHHNCDKAINSSHFNIDRWSEVFNITNQSTRQQLLCKKSVSGDAECYVLQRQSISLDELELHALNTAWDFSMSLIRLFSITS
ncbi:hypothetical protein DdX_07112 [Ditylenchus destructor]|uniref:Uncharacterized protein n=1 Tax=Ditylenchus destructor TaxID=166010 RepID=A0AAD4N8Q9_9BILA|nr:hypothetical protein DdX_07112 [Ditylenchus destructor]